MESIAQKEADLANLNRMIRAGITTVVVGGQTTVFASIKDMRSVARELEEDLARCKGLAPQRPRVSSINLSRGV